MLDDLSDRSNVLSLGLSARMEIFDSLHLLAIALVSRT